MPSLKKVRAQLVGFATVLVLALGLGAAPASADDASVTVNGVGYVINGSGEAVASMYTSDLPADLSIPTSVRLAGSTYPVTQIGGAVFASPICCDRLNAPPISRFHKNARLSRIFTALLGVRRSFFQSLNQSRVLETLGECSDLVGA